MSIPKVKRASQPVRLALVTSAGCLMYGPGAPSIRSLIADGWESKNPSSAPHHQAESGWESTNLSTTHHFGDDAIFVRSLRSASALQYLQSRRIKTDV